MARNFVGHLAEVDRGMRRSGITIPPVEIKQRVTSRFWELIGAIDQFEVSATEDPMPVRDQCRGMVADWLFRSRFFNRSYHKPHGHAGDYRMVEWMYDLENDACADPTQPGIVNCLDHVFATVHSVRSVWERRRWFARLLQREHRRHGRQLRILDVACGGARYIADFLTSADDVQGIEVTLVDQDAAALEYCREVSLRHWRPCLTTQCLPIKRLPEALTGCAFDIVLSAGLFDYLDDAAGTVLLEHLVHLTVPDGVTVVANFHPADPSRNVKDWLVDWPLIFRNEAALAALFPDPSTVQTSLSENGALTYALATRPRLDETRQAYPDRRSLPEEHRTQPSSEEDTRPVSRHDLVTR
jgi:SAM-dependent methyltransferase